MARPNLQACVLKREFNLKVTTKPILSWLPTEKETHDFEVLVRVDAPLMVAERTPIDLVAVVDVSGSMGYLPDNSRTADKVKGEQSRMDHLKTAMSSLIKMLHDDDRLATVQFNSGVKHSTPLAPISGGGRESALELVDGLVPDGGTSFKPALEEALRILGPERAKDNSSNRIAFIIFLSDGQEDPPNASGIDWDTVTAHPFGAELRKHPVYTFGFTRFHEPTALWGISKASLGTYSFIDNDLGKLKDAFSFCVGDLSTAFAVNATIALFARDGVTIQGIDSGGFNNAVNEDGRAGEIYIPMLYAGDVKNFIVHLSLRPTATAGQQVLFEISLNAGDSKDNNARDGAPLSIQRPDGGHGDESCQRDMVVLDQVTRFKLLKLLENVPKEELRNEPGREKWAKLLRNKWDQLREDSSLSNTFDKDVYEMARKLEAEDMGRAYLYSYISSQQMERTTIKGTPSPSPSPSEDLTNSVVHMQETSVELLVPAARDIQIPDGKQRKNFPVLVRVVAPPKGGKEEHAPIDLVLVIDVSGSMNNNTTSSKFPTRLSMAKAAALLFKNHLGQGDRLAIVPFSTDVVDPTELIEMNYNGRLLVNYRLMGLCAGGDGRFLPALKYASNLLRGRNGDDAYRPGFIFFISDGEDRSVLDPQNVHFCADYPVHTVGLWHKCNPASMVHIAKQTGGTYHLVKEDASNIARVVDNFLAGILSVAAMRTHIDVHVTGAGQGSDEDDVRITKIESGSYPSDILHGGKFSKIDVGVLYAGEEKRFVVNLNIPAMPIVGLTGATEQHVLAVSGSYNKPTLSESMSMDTKTVGITRFGRRGPVSAPSTLLLSPTTTTTTYIQLLIAEIVRIEAVHIVSTVLGKHKDAEQKNKVISMELEAAWNKFKCSSDHESNVLQELVAGSAEWQQYAKQVVEQHGDVIKAMQATLIWEEHVGVQYVHAWLASHQAQRETTVASDAVTASSWSQLKYMEQTLLEMDTMSSSLVEKKEMDPCKCVDLDRIDQRLDMWSRVKRDLPLLFQPSEDPDSHHLTTVFREASLEAINRAMHHEMYLAIVHDTNLRRCYGAGGKQQQGHGGPSAAAPLLTPAKPSE